MKILYCLIIYLTLAACYSGKVPYSYDKGTDFTTYKTFNFIPDQAALPADEINQNMLMEVVTDYLRGKGMDKSEKPDMLIDIKLLQQIKKKEVREYSKPTAPTDVIGNNQEPKTFQRYVEGTLFVRILDAANRHMVFQGQYVEAVDPGAKPARRKKVYKRLVAKLFAKYPPVEMK